MKALRIILSLPLLAFCLACSPRPSIDFKLSWAGDKIHVDMSMNPIRHGTDTLYYGDIGYGGQRDIFGCVKDLRMNVPFCTDSANLRIILQIPDKKKVTASYDIACSLPDTGVVNTPMEMFRPNITQDFLFCHGVNLFLRYNDRVGRDLPVQVSWDEIPPFPTFCLYNQGQGFRTARAPSSAFQSTILVGDRHLHVDTVHVAGQTQFIVTAPRKLTEYNQAMTTSFFKDFYAAAVRFWEDTPEGPYSLIVYPFERIRHNVSGIGLDGGFCARYDAQADTVVTPARADVYAHEIGHNWVSAGFSSQWYGEGFNELQTAYLLVASGLRPLQGFVDYLNVGIRSLERSAIRNLPNDEIEENFWKLGDYSWLPYWRGEVYALRLLGQIEAHTGDPTAFKSLMLFLKRSGTQVNNDNWIGILKNFIPEETAREEFQRYIIQGESIPLDRGPLPSGLDFQRQEDGTPGIVITDSTAFARHFVL